ncbi:hypothetical protein ACIBM3_32440 [Rhodococcus erythropolis]|uniref:hypothetical protein n=1 Tax=Rhodococcus erythropolis TaxID=1833 RepID=UPI0037B6048B
MPLISVQSTVLCAFCPNHAAIAGLVLSLGVNNQDGSGFGISSGLDTLAATIEIAYNFHDFNEWL